MPSTPTRLAALVEGYLTALRDDRGAPCSTVRTYRSHLRLWLATLGPQAPLAAFTREAVQAWIRRQTHLAPATRRGRIHALRSLGTWAMREGVLTASPAHEVETPSGPNALPRLLSTTEVRTVLATTAAATDAQAIRDTALLEVLATTGLRAGEVLGLDVSDVALEPGWLAIRHAKGGQVRVVPLLPRAREALRRLLTAQAADIGPVFRSHRGRRLLVKNLGDVVRRRGRAAGLTGRLHSHAFRHYTATVLYEATGDIRAVQLALGHKRISTTERYIHLSPGRLAAVAAQHPLVAA